MIKIYSKYKLRKRKIIRPKMLSRRTVLLLFKAKKELLQMKRIP